MPDTTQHHIYLAGGPKGPEVWKCRKADCGFQYNKMFDRAHVELMHNRRQVAMTEAKRREGVKGPRAKHLEIADEAEYRKVAREMGLNLDGKKPNRPRRRRPMPGTGE